MPERRVFLSAEWRELVMLNYEVKPGMLPGCLRSGVELDSFEGRTFIGLFGFQFPHTKLHELLAVPFQNDFDEVNLRFHVRRRAVWDKAYDQPTLFPWLFSKSLAVPTK